MFFYFDLSDYCCNVAQAHPSLEQDLSLKIEERDQTIWICIQEL